jgi:hypothetical protein
MGKLQPSSLQQQQQHQKIHQHLPLHQVLQKNHLQQPRYHLDAIMLKRRTVNAWLKQSRRRQK